MSVVYNSYISISDEEKELSNWVCLKMTYSKG